ncbi:MAG TPA: preprotein translocase subunit SecG [Candidatus Acidoferrales bacterium]|jgi:protein translocase SecG subunit|nr:preprotein translocase subunit SecG [Candidatus Acidoferrales bacterium]
MSFLVIIFTFLLIINCAVLMLLILVQLPKKDAGAGLAFGGGAADALFGAGSGNALTKITKWATAAFILLSIILGSIEVKMNTGSQSEFEQGVEQQQQMQPTPKVQAPPPSAASPASSAPSTPAMPLLTATNATTPMAIPASTNK